MYFKREKGLQKAVDFTRVKESFNLVAWDTITSLYKSDARKYLQSNSVEWPHPISWLEMR